MEIQMRVHGVMLIDYFHGSSGVTMPLHIDNNTTAADVVEMLQKEVNELWDHIEYTAISHEYDTCTLEADIVACIEEVEGQFENSSGPLCPGLETEEEECPVLVLSLEFI